MKIENYLDDGANWQAQAVLAYLRTHYNIESSWNKEYKKYNAEIQVARWENCREQGYIVWVHGQDKYDQLNIAFFEHRNIDSICAVKWEQNSINSITIETAQFKDVYQNKYDYSKSWNYGEILPAAKWIKEELENFWIENSQKWIEKNK